jgi:hypothetical protein
MLPRDNAGKVNSGSPLDFVKLRIEGSRMVVPNKYQRIETHHSPNVFHRGFWQKIYVVTPSLVVVSPGKTPARL